MVWCILRASKRISIISTISCEEKDTFDFCFEGAKTRSVIAISTYIVEEQRKIHATDHSQPNNHSDPHAHSIILNQNTVCSQLGPPINEILKFKNYRL